MAIRQAIKSRAGRRLGLWLIALGVWLAAPQMMLAQTPGDPGMDVPIKQLRVQVMPEFDDPRVLVIVQGRMDLDVSALPAFLTVRVPRGAQINQMATMDMNTGSTVAQPYDARPDADNERWTLVTYTLDNPHFFYEFYYNPLEGETDKQFTFYFSSPHTVEDVLIEVQQPRAATNFTMTPPATLARFDESFDLTYHQFVVGALLVDEETEISVSYTKTNPDPSVSREQVMAKQSDVMPEAAISSGTGQANSTIPPWLLVLFGAVLVVGIGLYVWNRQAGGRSAMVKSKPASKSVPEVSPELQAALEAQTSSEAQVQTQPQGQFCTQCGVALKPNARFCHFCGAPVAH